MDASPDTTTAPNGVELTAHPFPGGAVRGEAAASYLVEDEGDVVEVLLEQGALWVRADGGPTSVAVTTGPFRLVVGEGAAVVDVGHAGEGLVLVASGSVALTEADGSTRTLGGGEVGILDADGSIAGVDEVTADELAGDPWVAANRHFDESEVVPAGDEETLPEVDAETEAEAETEVEVAASDEVGPSEADVVAAVLGRLATGSGAGPSGDLAEADAIDAEGDWLDGDPEGEAAFEAWTQSRDDADIEEEDDPDEADADEVDADEDDEERADDDEDEDEVRGDGGDLLPASAGGAADDLPYHVEPLPEASDDGRKMVRVFEYALLAIVLAVGSLIIVLYNRDDKDPAGPPRVGDATSIVKGDESTEPEPAVTVTTGTATSVATTEAPAATVTTVAPSTTAATATTDPDPPTVEIARCTKTSATRLVMSGIAEGAEAPYTTYRISVAVRSADEQTIYGGTTIEVPVEDGTVEWQADVELVDNPTGAGCVLVDVKLI